MKVHWGWGIVVVFAIFGITMISLVIRMFQEPVNMVSKQYYAEEQMYEVQQQQKDNIKLLSAEPIITLNRADGNIDFILPQDIQDIKGSVRFFRPSDSRLDFNAPLKLNEANAMAIDASHLVKGRWIIKLSFSSKGMDYLYEKSLVL
ncbi:FixH family protein [Flammeovirga pacifica]|uniref:Nitrogen fixation protein FixH n=1 Tax=Flammeovirga pacifica TaxID=915059 RepID=A0A1S1Z0H2_FLAPC|nr:FixH family protein [Flammeovirga pacifica]OHX66752.1 hypothetical protein NH26_10480 [Flammeovirga pacifica]